MGSIGVHKDLYLHQLGNLVRIQPFLEGDSAAPALTIELKSGSVGLSEASVPLSKESGAHRIFGVIGLQPLLGGSALAIITGARKVCLLKAATSLSRDYYTSRDLAKPDLGIQVANEETSLVCYGHCLFEEDLACSCHCIQIPIIYSGCRTRV